MVILGAAFRITSESVPSTGKVGTRGMEYYNYSQEYIILGAASTMTNESVPSTGKGSTRGMEYCN